MCCQNGQLCRVLPFFAVFCPRMHSIVDAFFFNQLLSHAVQHFMRAPLCRWVGSCACFRRRRFPLGSLVQVFFPSVPLVLFRCRRPPFCFFFLTCLLSLGKVCVCWIVLPPFFSAAFCSCLGLLRFRCRSFSSHCFHFIFIFILITLVRTLTTVPPYWGGVCVCVCVCVRANHL